jgi:putative ABC transport system permease protein
VKEFFYSTSAFDASGLFLYTLSHAGFKDTRVFIPTIVSLMIVALAAILLVISLIVVSYRIINSIEEDMTNIGALKAIGYSSGQVVSSIVAQFMGLVVLGALSGTALSQLAMPSLSGLLESQSAFVWRPSFDMGLAVASCAVIWAAVLATAFASAMRIRSLDPLTALRFGIHTHSFTKNHVPLDTTPSPLALSLAMKHLLQSKRQAAGIALIISSVSFAAVSGISIYYNVGVETDDFISTVSGENPDCGLLLRDPGMCD